MGVWMKHSALPVRARSVHASAGVAELEIASTLCEEDGAEARGVVLHDATDGDVEVGEAGHALAKEAAGRSSFFHRGVGARRAVRSRAAVMQARRARLAKALHPLGRALDHGFGKFLSTMNRKSSMMVIVHSVSSVAVASQHQLPSSWPNGQQPIETSQLKPDHCISYRALPTFRSELPDEALHGRPYCSNNFDNRATFFADRSSGQSTRVRQQPSSA